jgi:RNA polymerase sigma factor (sigma-70 family)
LVCFSNALDALPQRQRTCLLLVQVEELPAHAVAEQLGVTPEAVRMNVHRARNRLRKCFDGARRG